MIPNSATNGKEKIQNVSQLKSRPEPEWNVVDLMSAEAQTCIPTLHRRMFTYLALFYEVLVVHLRLDLFENLVKSRSHLLHKHKFIFPVTS